MYMTGYTTGWVLLADPISAPHLLRGPTTPSTSPIPGKPPYSSSSSLPTSTAVALHWRHRGPLSVCYGSLTVASTGTSMCCLAYLFTLSSTT